MKDALLKLGYNVTGGVDSPYLWVNVKGDSWEFFDKLLKEANVVTTPGAGFGKDGQGYIRISAFNSRDMHTLVCITPTPIFLSRATAPITKTP